MNSATASEKSSLGIGVYTVAEAAAFARIKPATLSRWLGMSPDSERVLRPELPETGEKLVTFLDYFQALSVKYIRKSLKISLQKVRDALNKATDEFGVDFPLAHRHLTYAIGRELYIRVVGADSDVQYVGATGKEKNQFAMEEIVELSMRDVLEWTPEGYVGTLRAFQWSGHDIVMNPKRRFGEPIVLSCGYTALALCEAFRSEGGFEAAASAYGVEPDEVEAAFRYYDHLDKAA